MNSDSCLPRFARGLPAFCVALCLGLLSLLGSGGGGTDDPPATNTPPAISQQPAAQSVVAGGSVTFSVSATGSAPLAYQWQRAASANSLTWTDVYSGGPSYTIAAVDASLNGQFFRVAVVNPYGTAFSSAVLLTVTGTPSAPGITAQPADQLAFLPEPGVFTVAVSGSPTPAVQWQVSTDAGSTFSDIAGATGTTLTTAATTLADSTKLFRAVATNSVNTVVSRSALLTVRNAGTGGTNQGVAVAGGNVYVTVTPETGFVTGVQQFFGVRVITAANTVQTLAGGSTQGDVDGTGSAARFGNPYGIAVDAGGNVFVTDNAFHKIRKVTPAGVVTTLAGGDVAGGFADGTGAAASFRQPAGLAIDSSGNLYVADTFNHAIRKVTPAGVVTTLAGLGTFGFVDGPAATAKFNSPRNLAVDGAGNVFVADLGNRALRKITPDGVVSTVALGSDGPVPFTAASGVALDLNGDLLITAGVTNCFRVTQAGVVSILPVGGTFTVGPVTLAVDGAGNIYIPDQAKSLAASHEIRKISPAGVAVQIP